MRPYPHPSGKHEVRLHQRSPAWQIGNERAAGTRVHAAAAGAREGGKVARAGPPAEATQKKRSPAARHMEKPSAGAGENKGGAAHEPRDCHRRKTQQAGQNERRKGEERLTGGPRVRRANSAYVNAQARPATSQQKPEQRCGKSGQHNKHVRVAAQAPPATTSGTHGKQAAG